MDAKKQVFTFIILIVLISAVSFQTYSLFSLSKRLASESLKIGTVNAASISLPSNFDDLPDMAGGC